MSKKNRGWIKIYRKIDEDIIWGSDEPFDRRSAWIDLLLMVNHEDRSILINGRRVVVGEGQVWTSVRALALRWGWSKGRVMRYLDLLERDTKITCKRTGSGTLLTVEKYGVYQHGRDTNRDTDEDTHEDADRDANRDKTRRNIRTNNKNEKEKGPKPQNPFLEGYQ